MSLPLEKLTLRAIAIGTGFGLSENEKTQLAVSFEIVEDDQYAGETISWLGHFTEKTTARTLESLQHMGFQSDDISELEDLSRDDAMKALPNMVELVLEPEEYEGNWRQKVRWVNRYGGGRFAFKKPLKGNDLKAFAAQMKGALKNARGGAPRVSGSATQPPHPNAPGNNDDLPF